LFAVDPDTGDVVRDPIQGVVTNTGGAPRIAVGNGRVWLRSTNVVVVDPKDGSVLETVPSVGTVSAGSSATIEASTAAVWAPAGGGFSGRPSRIERLDPNTYAPLRPITLDSDATVTDAAFDGDDAWVSFSDGTVLELDVSTGKQLAEYRLGGSIDEIEADTDAVWALDEVAGIVTRLDPSDGHVVETFTVSPNTREIDAGEGGLWMLDVQAGTVTLIDETRNQSGGPIAVGPEPSQLSVGLGAVWVASLDGTLHRVNPLTSRDEQDFDLGAPLSAIAVDPTTRTIWLTVESQG
jgi:outer membrane protein assembly factor BamB